MEAIYKLKANVINTNLMVAIKKLFSGKEITITISTSGDETEYLTMSPANEAHLMESIAEDPAIRFTPEEFQKKTSQM
jgi:hypothetical protein